MAKVSIIVPIYNSESYLNQCLQSICDQTYTDLEIVLINDGSTDGSLQICETFAKQDERICIVTQENLGRSAARNVGIASSNGEYILFVDSDDDIAKDMVEYLIKGLETYHADIAICGYYRINKGKMEALHVTEDEVLTREEALLALCENKKIKSYLWNQLIPRYLLQDIEFVRGHNFEDIMAIHQWFEKASKIVLLKEPKYNYYMRQESISASSSANANFDRCLGQNKRRDDLWEHWSHAREALDWQCFLMFRKMVRDMVPKEKRSEEFFALCRYYQNYADDLAHNGYLSAIEKKEAKVMKKYKGGCMVSLMLLEAIRLIFKLLRWR